MYFLSSAFRFKSQLDLQAEPHAENLFPSTSYLMLEAGNIRNIV